jgi:hypothetical protein
MALQAAQLAKLTSARVSGSASGALRTSPPQCLQRYERPLSGTR